MPPGGTVLELGCGTGRNLLRGDATRFDCAALFGLEKVDRVFASHTLSMIPDWQQAVEAGLDCLEPGGSLHIVDFGGQQRLPRIFGHGLRRWLAHFHVTPRHDLQAAVAAAASRRGAAYEFRTLYRDYAWLLRVTLPTR